MTVRVSYLVKPLPHYACYFSIVPGRAFLRSLIGKWPRLKSGPKLFFSRIKTYCAVCHSISAKSLYNNNPLKSHVNNLKNDSARLQLRCHASDGGRCICYVCMYVYIIRPMHIKEAQAEWSRLSLRHQINRLARR